MKYRKKLNKYYDPHFKRQIVTIFPGEFYTSDGEEMISTVLGSCIATIFFDSKLRLGGMNHFMLAYCKDYEKRHPDTYGRFGIYAMEMLLNDLYKKGCEKKNLVAKVFGGSNVLKLGSVNSEAKVGDVNSDFAFKFLEDEGIPVVSSNVGGLLPRKIFFDGKTSKVWLKHIKADYEVLEKQELDYLDNLHQQEDKTGDVRFFT